LSTNFDERVLLVQNFLSSQKEMRDSKRTSLPNALSKETLGQTLANPRENSSFFLLIQRD